MFQSDKKTRRHGIPLRSTWTSSTWTYVICCCIILTSFIGGTEACSPCHSKCSCSAKADKTCSVDCSRASLSNPPTANELPDATTISELLLGGNSISTLSPDSFKAFTNLKKLVLSENKLTTLPDGILQPLTSITHLDLSLNSWKCDCGLQWLRTWITNNDKAYTATASTTCNDPLSLHGHQIKKLDESKFVCEPKDLVSCHVDKDTATTSPVFYQHTASTNSPTNEQCNNYCFHKDYTYAIIYDKKCSCGVNAKTVLTTCACPNIITVTEPSNGSTLCKRKYMRGGVGVHANIRFGYVPVIPSPGSFTFTLTSSLEAPLSYTWSVQGPYSPPATFTTTDPKFTYNFLHIGAHVLNVTITAGKRTETASLPVRVASGVRSALSCPKYSNIDDSINATVVSFSASPVHVRWNRTYEDGTSLSYPACPTGAVFQDGYCLIIVSASATWQDAEGTCNGKGGHLISLQSSSEFTALKSKLLGSASGSEYWIGLADRSYNGLFTWSSGETLGSYTNWAAGQPDEKSPPEDCVMLKKSRTDWQWHDTSCNAKLPFLCQFRLGTSINGSSVQMVGNGDFGWGKKFTEITKVTKIADRKEKTVAVFPGLWLTSITEIRAWEFMTTVLSEKTRLHFQLFSPFCRGRQDRLVPPGCKVVASPYAVCDSKSPDCPTKPKCPSFQGLCLLDNTCKNLTMPCNCHNVKGYSGCSNTPLRHQGTVPSFKLVQEFPVELEAGPSKLYRLSTSSSYALGNYVVGVSFNSDSNPIKCVKSTSSPLRHNYLSKKQANWVALKDTPDAFSSASWENDQACSLRVIGNTVTMSDVPTDITANHTFTGKPGAYTFKATVGNALGTSDIECYTTVMEPIEGLELLSPVHIPAGTQTSSLTPHVLDVDIQHHFLIKITRGSHQSASLEDGKTTPMNFTDICPNTFSQNLCKRKTTYIPKPFASGSRTYTTSTTLTSITFKVQNNVSVKQLVFKVKFCQRISELVIRNTSVAVANKPTTFYAEIGTGSCVSYEWHLSGTVIKSASTSNRLDKTFGSTGTFNLTVKASNQLNSVTKTYLVTVIVYANPRNLKFLSPPAEAFVGKSVSFSVTVAVYLNKQFSILFDFGDGSKGILSTHQASQSPYTITQKHTYASPLASNVKANASDTGSWVDAEHDLLVRFADIKVELTSAATHVATGKPISFRAAAKVETSGYTLKYTWKFGVGTVPLTRSTTMYVYSFKAPGTYTVSVTVSTGFNDATDSVIVTVEDAITGLALARPEHVFENTAVKFTALVATGTNVKYIFETDSTANSLTTSPDFTYSYPKALMYTLVVTANNSISQISISKSIMVLDQTFLNLTDLVVPTACSRVDSVLTFSAKVVHVSATSLDFIWDFGDGTPAEAKRGVLAIQHKYTTDGHFKVNLTVKSPETSVWGTRTVCVEGPILKITLTPNVTVVGILSNQPGTISVGVTVTPASDYQTFQWSFNGAVETGSPTKQKLFSLAKPGRFTLSLKVENKLFSLTETVVLEAQTIITGTKLQNNLVEQQFVKTSKEVQVSATTDTGTNVSFSWVFGDGNKVDRTTNALQKHSYKPRGLYKLTVNASNLVSYEVVALNISVQDSISGTKLTITPPVADIKQAIQFTASASAGSDFSYEWKLCSSCKIISGNDKTIAYKYVSTGKLTASVTVMNKVSNETATAVVHVLEKISMLRISMNVSATVVKGSTVPMEAVCDSGSELTYSWVIKHTVTGVSTTHTTRVVQFTYNSNGEYSVKVTVTNALGKEDATKTIDVQDKIANLEIIKPKTYAEVGETLSFTAKIASGTDVSYEWNFGDGVKLTVSKSTVSHTFTSHGTYKIFLTAKNSVSTLTTNVTVEIEVRVTGVGVIGCCSKVLVSNAATAISATTATGSNMEYAWTITGPNGKPLIFSGMTIHPSFLTHGSFKIKLEIRNHINTLGVEKTVIVQTKIDKVLLVLQQDRDKLFVDQTVSIDVTTGQGSDMKYSWTVNDARDSFTGSSMKRVFTTQGVFRLKVDVYNDISSGTAQIEIIIRKLLCQIPELTKVSQSKVEIRKSQDLDLEVETDTMGCVLYTVTYLWTVYASPCGSQISKSIVKLSMGLRISDSVLHLPSRTLSIGVYCMMVNVTYEGIHLDLTEEFEVEIKASSLQAVIEGGDKRLHGSSAPLAIGSGSYDPDAIPSKSGLKYQWTCTAVSPTPPLPDTCFKQPTNGATLNIPKDSLVKGARYTFTLTVSDGGSRNKVTTQEVSVHSSAIPNVFISCLSCQHSGSYDVQPYRSLTIKGSCENCQGKTVTYHWSMVRSDGRVLAIDSANSATGNGKLNLVIKPGILKSTFSYDIKLTIKEQGTDLEGYALIKLKAALSTVGIACKITPTTTAVLEDPVSITCSGANASAHPNRYRVSMKWTDSANTKREIVMYYGQNPKTKVYLTHIGNEATSSVTVQVAMENDEGQITLIESSVIRVTELDLPKGSSRSGYIREKIETVFTGLKRKGDTVKLLQYSVAIVVELNKDRSTGKKEKEDKIFIRDCLLQGLNVAAVTSLERVGVMSPILDRVTSVEDEFPSTKNELSNILSSINSYLVEYLTYGSDSEVSNPASLASAISNILDILHSNTSKQQEMKNIMRDSQSIFLRYAMMKVPDEQPVQFDTKGFSYIGTKTTAGAMSRSVQLKNGAIQLQPETVPGSSSQEVVQVAMVNYKNPYSWGYKEGYPITTGVTHLTLYDSNSNEIAIKNLPKEKSVVLTVIKEGNTASVVNGKHESFMPTKNVQYTNRTLLPSASINVVVNSSKLGLATPGAALFIQVRFVAAKVEFPAKGMLIHAFLGSGFKPTLTSFTKYMLVQSKKMAVTEDYRDYTFFVNQSSFPPSKDYHILIQNNNTVSINLTIGIYISSCQFYTKSETWSNDGCEPLDTSTATVTVCRCNHLTAFGASALVPPNAIDFTDFTRLDLATNPVAIALCSAVLLLYLLVLIWARKADIRDEKKSVVVPLCGKDGPYRYEISVYTGMMPGAGTTAQVGLKLYGEYDKSDAKHLYRANAFQRNGHDVLVVASEKNLGNIWQIRVWHDNTGRHPSWFLSHINVRDLQTNCNTYFPVSSWLTINAPYGVVEKRVKAASSHELGKYSLRLRNEAASAFSEKHAWASVFEHRDRSRFTRVQRLTCCVTLLYTFMLANAMWYGIFKNEDDRWKTIWNETFSWEEIVIGILSSVLAFPVNLVIMQIFRKSRVELDPLKRQPKQETIEMDDLCNVPRHGSIIYDNNGNPCRLKRTEAMMKIIREGSSSDSMRTKDTSDIGTWSSASRNSSDRHREELAKKLHLNGDDPKLWSYDSILQWPEALPSWKEHDTDSPPLRQAWRKLSTQDSGNDSPEKEKRPQKRSSLARMTRKMSIDTLLKFCEEDLQEEERDMRAGKRVSLGDTKSTSTESTRKFSLPRRSRRVSTNTTLTGGGTETIPSTCMEDDVWSSLPTEMSEVSDFGSEYGLGSRRTTMVSAGISDSFDRRSTFCRNLSEGEFSIGREETFDMDSASMARSASIIASYGSRSFTSTSSGSKLNRTSSQSLIRIPPVKRKKKQCLLPHCCIYLAYSLCAALSILSIIMVILYGHKFGREVALKWLLALFISFLMSAFITETLKVLFIAIFLAAVTKQVDQRIEDNVDVSPLLESNEKIKEDKMKPIKGFALLQALVEGRKVHRMQQIIRQSIVYFFFIFIILVINYANHDTKAYYLTQNVYNTLVNSSVPLSGRTLKSFRSQNEIWSWLETITVPYVHSENATESYRRLIGAVRFRQIRGKQDNCTIKLDNIYNARFQTNACYGKRLFDEDTASYDKGWSLSEKGQWKHQTTDDWPHTGVYQRYESGGYITTLSTTLADSLKAVHLLRQNNWINTRTRALFVDFTIFNANTDLYAVVKIFFEIGGHAGMTSSIEIHTNRFFKYTPGVFHYFDIFMVLLLIVFLYLLAHIVFTIKEERKYYVQNIWNWIELAMTLVMGSSIAMYVFLMYQSTTVLAVHRQGSGFFNFGPLAYHHAVFKRLNAVMLFLLFCKIANQFRFIKMWSNFGAALGRSLVRLLWLFLLFTLIWLIYGMVGYLMLGPGVYAFRSYGASILSLILTIRGHMDFLKPYEYNPWFSGIFFFTYVFLVFVFIFGLIIAVLQKAYHLSKSRTKYPCNLDLKDYEMIDFMMERFKVWAGINKPKKVSRSFRKVKFKGMPSVSTRSTYSSTGASTSGQSTTSTTSFEALEKMCRESQYNDQMVERLPPSWEEVVAKMEKLLSDDNEEAKLCSDIARRMIKSAFSVPASSSKQAFQAADWRSKSSVKASFIYSSETRKTPRPVSPNAQPQSIMKKQTLPKLNNQQSGAIPPKPAVRPKTNSRPRMSTSSNIPKSFRPNPRGSVSTTVSDYSIGKSSSSHSVISSASNMSGNSNKSDNSHMSVVSVRSNASSDDGRVSKSVHYTSDTKPPVAPKVAPTRESLPGRLNTARPSAATPRRPQHILKSVSKNAW